MNVDEEFRQPAVYDSGESDSSDKENDAPNQEAQSVKKKRKRVLWRPDNVFPNGDEASQWINQQATWRCRKIYETTQGSKHVYQCNKV